MELEKTFGEVYDFVHRNNLPVCIFRCWTWASLNFGELNLYLPPQLKIQAGERECGPLTAEEDTFLFQAGVLFLFSFFFSNYDFFLSFCCVFVSQGFV